MAERTGMLVRPAEEYLVGCIKCGATKHLTMVPQRVATETGRRIVGWVFVCADCSEQAYGASLAITFKEAESD